MFCLFTGGTDAEPGEQPPCASTYTPKPARWRYTFSSTSTRVACTPRCCQLGSRTLTTDIKLPACAQCTARQNPQQPSRESLNEARRQQPQLGNARGRTLAEDKRSQFQPHPLAPLFLLPFEIGALVAMFFENLPVPSFFPSRCCADLPIQPTFLALFCALFLQFGWCHARIKRIFACPQSGSQATFHSAGRPQPRSVRCNGGPHLYHLELDFTDGTTMFLHVDQQGEVSPLALLLPQAPQAVLLELSHSGRVRLPQRGGGSYQLGGDRCALPRV